MTHLYLIRHGDYIEDLEHGKYVDLGLSPAGVRQTELLHDRLTRTGEIKADVLIASPLRRAHESAQILAPALGQPIVLDQAIAEWRCEDGSLTPKEFNARWQQVPDPQKPFFRWVDGYETWLEFSVRAQSALNRVVQEHADKTIVLICHGGIIQASFIYFFGCGDTIYRAPAIDTKSTSITHWFKPKDRWLLERHNDYYHLVG